MKSRGGPFFATNVATCWTEARFTKWLPLGSEVDSRSGCSNYKHQQQSFPGLHFPGTGRSDSIMECFFWFQTIPVLMIFVCLFFFCFYICCFNGWFFVFSVFFFSGDSIKSQQFASNRAKEDCICWKQRLHAERSRNIFFSRKATGIRNSFLFYANWFRNVVSVRSISQVQGRVPMLCLLREPLPITVTCR